MFISTLRSFSITIICLRKDNITIMILSTYIVIVVYDDMMRWLIYTYIYIYIYVYVCIYIYIRLHSVNMLKILTNAVANLGNAVNEPGRNIVVRENAFSFDSIVCFLFFFLFLWQRYARSEERSREMTEHDTDLCRSIVCFGVSFLSSPAAHASHNFIFFNHHIINLRHLRT